jgi:hypothetical protein
MGKLTRPYVNTSKAKKVLLSSKKLGCLTLTTILINIMKSF